MHCQLSIIGLIHCDPSHVRIVQTVLEQPVVYEKQSLTLTNKYHQQSGPHDNCVEPFVLRKEWGECPDDKCYEQSTKN